MTLWAGAVLKTFEAANRLGPSEKKSLKYQIVLFRLGFEQYFLSKLFVKFFIFQLI